MAKIKRKCGKCGRTGHYKTTCKKVARKSSKKKTAKKKTTKKVTKKTAKIASEYWVAAYYSTKKHGWGALDGKIAKAAGRRENGAGTMMKTGVRDLTFDFKSKDAAERAVKRLRKVKGVSKVKMWPVSDKHRKKARKKRRKNSRRG